MWKFSKHRKAYTKPRHNQQRQLTHKQKVESVLTMALAARLPDTLSPRKTPNFLREIRLNKH